MIKIVLRNLLVLAILAVGDNLQAQNGPSFDKYKNNSEVQKALTLLQQKSPSTTALHKITDSPGGEPIYVLEIGKDLKNVPAIFVGANFEGKTPLSTEGALYLAKMLLDSANYTRKVKWMILREGYFDGNRNWGYDWQPTYAQNGAGNFPLCALGINTIAAYIHQRPNIIVNFAFHNSGGMWLRAPSIKSDLVDPKDVAVYDLIGKNALKMTPGTVYQPSYDLYDTHGDTDSHMFNLEGSYTFVGELFMRSQETYRENVNKPVVPRLYAQDMLKVTGAKVIASGKINDLRNNKISYQEHKPETIYTSVPSYGFSEYQFLVEGKGDIKVNYNSRKAVNLVKTLKL
jgi:hypothetical protein